MAEFAVPAAVLASPHYQDAIFWVYSHMIVLGLVIGAIGVSVEDGRWQRRIARLLSAAYAYDAGLDARASDSVVGDGLYQGSGSLVPVFVSLAVTLLVGHLAAARLAS